MREGTTGWGVIILIALGLYGYNHWTVSPEVMHGVCEGLRDRGIGCTLDGSQRRITLSHPMIDGDPADEEDHDELCEPLRRLRGWTVVMRGDETRRELFHCTM